MALVTARYCDICKKRAPPVINVRLNLPGALMSIGSIVDQETATVDMCLTCLKDIGKHLTIRSGAS